MLIYTSDEITCKIYLTFGGKNVLCTLYNYRDFRSSCEGTYCQLYVCTYTYSSAITI